MVKTKLKSTSNSNMQYLVGVEGVLSYEADNKFHFRFVKDGKSLDLSSHVKSQLGDLDNPLSEEVCFQTNNSIYVFEKIEKIREGLFSHHKGNSLDNKILNAQEERAHEQAIDAVYGSMCKGHNFNHELNR